MVHGYHVIFGTYGFWLPNDPRGSWSNFVGNWELVRFGRTTKSIDRNKLASAEKRQQQQAKLSLRYPAVRLTGLQAQAAGIGFSNSVRKSNLTVWACSILEEHVHLVIARHTYKVEQITNLMKGEATKQLTRSQAHPSSTFATPPKSAPTLWAANCWKVYLDSDDAIEGAIKYVEQNPIKEGKLAQRWSCVSKFRGLDAGHVIYH